MTGLAQQQQALLDALFAMPNQYAIKIIAACAIDTGARGLKAYKTNGHMLAQRALAGAYPVVAQLLGDESFGDLARALWHAHPPVRGDVAQWGAALAEFVRTSPQLQDEPYLHDVATVEWALHRCATAANGAAELATLALLTTHDPDRLHLVLAPGCATVQSPWPVVSILNAHLEQSPSFAVVGQQLRDRLAQDAVVWRAGLRPCVREAVPGEAEFLQAVLHGKTLGPALDAAPTLDFGLWLPMAVQSSLVLSVVAQELAPESADMPVHP
jgi:hypothetical protein